jgi:hypothetical protein
VAFTRVPKTPPRGLPQAFESIRREMGGSGVPETLVLRTLQDAGERPPASPRRATIARHATDARAARRSRAARVSLDSRVHRGDRPVRKMCISNTRIGTNSGTSHRGNSLHGASAFHEKAGECQVGFSSSLLVDSLSSSRAASVAILPYALFLSDFRSGACWVFPFQQVLLPDNRPWLPSLRQKLGQALGAVT